MTDSAMTEFEFIVHGLNVRQNNFEFVMQDPNKSFSKGTRSRIRRQAMQAVGDARRKSRHVPCSSPSRIPKNGPQPNLNLRLALTPFPLSGLELLVRDLGLDPNDLSALASIHNGTVSVLPCQTGSDSQKADCDVLQGLKRTFLRL